jgi:hypothetical protein
MSDDVKLRAVEVFHAWYRGEKLREIAVRLGVSRSRAWALKERGARALVWWHRLDEGWKGRGWFKWSLYE